MTAKARCRRSKSGTSDRPCPWGQPLWGGGGVSGIEGPNGGRGGRLVLGNDLRDGCGCFVQVSEWMLLIPAGPWMAAVIAWMSLDGRNYFLKVSGSSCGTQLSPGAIPIHVGHRRGSALSLSISHHLHRPHALVLMLCSPVWTVAQHHYVASIHRAWQQLAKPRFNTAPIVTWLIPETPLKTIPLQNHACSIQNSIWGAEFRTLGPVASRRPKRKIPGVPAGAVGCRVQDPGTRGYRWWKTADFSHSARCAP